LFDLLTKHIFVRPVCKRCWQCLLKNAQKSRLVSGMSRMVLHAKLMSSIHKHCCCVSACSQLVKTCYKWTLHLHACLKQLLFCDVQEAQTQLAMLPTLVVANHSTILLTIMFVQSDILVAEPQNNCKLLHHCLIVMLLQLKR